MSDNAFAARDELRLVPHWAWALGAASFVIVHVVLLRVFESEPNPPALALRLVIVTPAAALLAGFLALVGYVSRDARRRGMNAPVWTAIALLAPQAIGLIVYFLVRRPLEVPCDGCGAAVRAQANWCPMCGHPRVPACARCGRPRQVGDRYCSHCGQALPAAG